MITCTRFALSAISIISKALSIRVPEVIALQPLNRCSRLQFLPVVREKAKQIIELLNDNERIRDEREKARRLRDKYVGVGGSANEQGMVVKDLRPIGIADSFVL